MYAEATIRPFSTWFSLKIGNKKSIEFLLRDSKFNKCLVWLIKMKCWLFYCRIKYALWNSYKKNVRTINIEICMIYKYIHIWARNDLPVGISNRNIVRNACGKSVFEYSYTAFRFGYSLYLQHIGACARQYVCTVCTWIYFHFMHSIKALFDLCQCAMRVQLNAWNKQQKSNQ